MAVDKKIGAKLLEEWRTMIEQIAEENRISPCQASSIAYHSLLILEDLDRLTKLVDFSVIEHSILEVAMEATCNICLGATSSKYDIWELGQ